MKKGVSRWEVFRFNEAAHAAKKQHDFLGTVEAMSESDARAQAFADLGLRTEEERQGVFVEPCRY